MARNKPDTTNRSQAISPRGWLLRVALLYAAACAVYAALAFILRGGPIVTIDESLYTNLARSLAWEGRIAYRSQPVNYPYILYPALLVPLYWLNALLGGDVYRWVQGFNVLLVCSSVFPAYCLASDFSGDRKKGFAAACITAIMPDMMMGFFEMTEALLWPLALWCVFFAWKMFAREAAIRWPVLVGAFSGLMFAAKPGAVAMGAGMLAYMLAAAIRDGDRAQAKRALVAVGSGALVIALMYAVDILLLGYRFSLLGLYEKQTSDWNASHAVAAAGAVFLMAFAFTFACAGYFALLPYFHLKAYEPPQRRLILASTAGLALVLIGTAVLVVPYQWSGNFWKLPIHLRYAAMYIPVWFIFCQPDGIKGASRGMTIALAAFGALCIFPGVRMGFEEGRTSVINALSLSAFNITRRLNGRITGLFLTIAMVVFVLFMLSSMGSKRNSGFKGFVTGCFAFTLLFNAVCGGCACHVAIDPTVGADACELNALLRGEGEVLGVMQRNYDDIYSYWQEARLSRPMQQVTVDQMFVELERGRGVYAPFVPQDQAPNVGNRATPDTNTFVLGQTIAEHMELNDAVSTVTTANGHYTIARGAEGQRLADTMMYGLAENMLYTGGSAILECFDGRTGTMPLSVTLKATKPGTEVTLSGNGFTQTRTLNTVEPETLRVEVPAGTVNLSADANIEILQYSTREGQ